MKQSAGDVGPAQPEGRGCETALDRVIPELL